MQITQATRVYRRTCRGLMRSQCGRSTVDCHVTQVYYIREFLPFQLTQKFLSRDQRQNADLTLYLQFEKKKSAGSLIGTSDSHSMKVNIGCHCRNRKSVLIFDHVYCLVGDQHNHFARERRCADREKPADNLRQHNELSPRENTHGQITNEIMLSILKAQQPDCHFSFVTVDFN